MVRAGTRGTTNDAFHRSVPQAASVMRMSSGSSVATSLMNGRRLRPRKKDAAKPRQRVGRTSTQKTAVLVGQGFQRRASKAKAARCRTAFTLRHLYLSLVAAGEDEGRPLRHQALNWRNAPISFEFRNLILGEGGRLSSCSCGPQMRDDLMSSMGRKRTLAS